MRTKINKLEKVYRYLQYKTHHCSTNIYFTKSNIIAIKIKDSNTIRILNIQADKYITKHYM